MSPLRILVADDQNLFRKGIVQLLRMHRGFEVVAESGNGLEAIQCARETMPDVILMDIEMPQCNGLEATARIKREMPHVHIVMLTVSEDGQDMFTAIMNGADGYLLKAMDPGELYDMLEGIGRGETPLARGVAAKILNEFRASTRAASPVRSVSGDLSPREIQVLELVVEGRTNKEIAAALRIAEDTVRNHLRNILEKLHLENRIQAAVYAVRQKLVNQPVNDTNG